MLDHQSTHENEFVGYDPLSPINVGDGFWVEQHVSPQQHGVAVNETWFPSQALDFTNDSSSVLDS
jgi:hypothetical protein